MKSTYLNQNLSKKQLLMENLKNSMNKLKSIYSRSFYEIQYIIQKAAVHRRFTELTAINLFLFLQFIVKQNF